MMGKPVILTRVVDTMVSTPRPTRAEATDIGESTDSQPARCGAGGSKSHGLEVAAHSRPPSPPLLPSQLILTPPALPPLLPTPPLLLPANGVLDGVDGFLLGAETLRGKYPELTVRTITSICR